MNATTYDPEKDPNAAPSLDEEIVARERQMSPGWEPNYCHLAREAYPASGVDRSKPCGGKR